MNETAGVRRRKEKSVFGLFGLRLPRSVVMMLAGAILVAASAAAILYFWSPKATLRITTGPAGGVAQRFIDAFIATTTSMHPRIRFQTVVVNNLEESAKALEDRKVDIALVRSDVATPSNGESLVILRRDVVALVTPSGSPIKSVSHLAGKTVAIPTGRTQEENSRALDMILNYYNVQPDSVKRLFLPVAEIGRAIRDKRAVAALAVGPIAPGDAVDVVSSIARATRQTPEVLALDDNDAIAKRFPGLESIDIPEGAFKAHPATPDDSIKGVAVSLRFAVPNTMLNAVAGVIARSILKTKAKLMALTPLASQIEAPDPDENNPLLPIHPGVANYLSSGDQSFLDEAQTYIYAIGIPLSVIGSALAIISGLLRNRELEGEQQRIFRLLVIADEATKANAEELDALEKEFKESVAACVNKLIQSSNASDQAPISLAIEHARRAIELRRRMLASGAQLKEPASAEPQPA
ncbi:MAG TPA: TAXI family TRAP transporter solute-binding subunit [Methylocystis sp.]|nr:TAXI family TRAP transporter solute-binding subunit [Methylocystis sp.]